MKEGHEARHDAPLQNTLYANSYRCGVLGGRRFRRIDLAVAEQARAFNLADAVVASTGEHMANAIFVADNMAFVELGCGGFSSVRNERFMGFVLGMHRSVKECVDGSESEGSEACMRGGLESSFTIGEEVFFGIVDELVECHREKIAFMRDL